MKPITVKDLKELINSWPDDAYLYEAQHEYGKKLYACDSHKTQTDDGYVTYNIYTFPEVPVKPLTNMDDIDWLIEHYKTVEWLENNTN